MPDNVLFEAKMMIDGKLVDGQAGAFTNINPATEEVLGEVADAPKADVHQAIDVARLAFDETEPYAGSASASGRRTAQPYGSRIRHEDEKSQSAILMRILQTPR